MGYLGPLGKNLNFFVSLGIAEILGFSELSVYTEIVLLHNTLNYAFTANIEEVMKFYNLGHKTFETDFSNHQCYDMQIKDGPLFFPRGYRDWEKIFSA